MEELRLPKWTPRPIKLPDGEPESPQQRKPTPQEEELVGELLEIKALFEECDALFGQLYDLLEPLVNKIDITPDPSDTVLAKALEAFGSPGRLNREVMDRALLALKAPSGVVPTDVSDGSGSPKFPTAPSTFESCVQYAESVRGVLTGNINPNVWAVDSTAGYSAKVQQIGRIKALKMVFYAILGMIVDLVAGMLKVFKYTPIGPLINKAISSLRKKQREAERNLMKTDPLGRSNINPNRADRYEIWLKIRKIRWLGFVPSLSWEWELALKEDNTPYQKISDIPFSYIQSLLTEPDLSSAPKTNIRQSRLGWTSVTPSVATSVSIFPLPVIGIPATYFMPISGVVQHFVVDTNTQYMDQDAWVIRNLPADIDADLKPTANDCTANAMAIMAALDAAHIYGDSSDNPYPNQAYFIYRSLGSIQDGYSAAKTTAKASFVAASEALKVMGMNDAAAWVNDLGRSTDRAFNWADRQLSDVYNDFQSLISSIDDSTKPELVTNQTTRREKLKRRFIKAFLGDLKTLLRQLVADMRNWVNDRTILCCFIQDIALSGRRWRPYIQLLRLAIQIIRNRGRNALKGFLAALLDLGKLIYNTALGVIAATLEALIKSGLAWAKNAINKQLSTQFSRNMRLHCLPLKAFAFSILGGIELMEEEILAYIKDFFSFQLDAVQKFQQLNEQAKYNDWLDHVDKMLAALDVALSQEIICKDGATINSVLNPAVSVPGAPSTEGTVLEGKQDGTTAAARTIQQLSAAGIGGVSGFGPITPDELIQFYRGFMHYTPAQIVQAMTSNWEESVERMKVLSQQIPEMGELSGTTSCIDKLSVTERQQMEDRLRQLEELEQKL